jgi:copper chaperone CopZ
MKLPILLLTAVTASAAGLCDLCPSSGVAHAAVAPFAVARPAAVLDTVTLRIEGMTCGGCTLATRKVLERLDGVTSADVSYEKKQAVVIHDPAKVTIAQMIAAVATLKYTATVVPK